MNSPPTRNELVVKQLTTRTIEDYLMFFEGPDNDMLAGCSGCYCVFFHTCENTEEWAKRTPEENKKLARKLIRNGTLSGFLGYLDTVPIVWCNVNEKSRFTFNKSRFNVHSEGHHQTVSIVCITVLPSYRRMGYAHQMVQKVIDHYSTSHYRRMEAYPAINKTSDEQNYHGPLSLYLKHGFQITKRLSEYDDFGDYEEYAIVQRELRKR